MTADAVLMALHRQLDAEVGPYLRLSYARGDAIRIGLFVDSDQELGAPEIKPILKRDEKQKAKC